MQELIETIRAAVASGASNDEKAAGGAACRTILTALDTEPGKPLAFPGSVPIQTMPRISFDQVLDLVIARLTNIANEREARPALVAPAAVAPATATPPAAAPTTAAPQVSRGLRVPMAGGSALRAAARSSGATQSGKRRR